MQREAGGGGGLWVRAAVSALLPPLLSVRPVKNGGPLGTGKGRKKKAVSRSAFGSGRSAHSSSPLGLVSIVILVN